MRMIILVLICFLPSAAFAKTADKIAALEKRVLELEYQLKQHENLMEYFERAIARIDQRTFEQSFVPKEDSLAKINEFRENVAPILEGQQKILKAQKDIDKQQGHNHYVESQAWLQIRKEIEALRKENQALSKRVVEMEDRR